MGTVPNAGSAGMDNVHQETQAEFDEKGWVVQRGRLDADLVTDLADWTDELEKWARTGGPGLHHFEQTDHGPVVARSERFADEHRELGDFIRGSLIGDTLTALFGEPALLFKEKVNYKYPGGGGFAPHQDATAYRFVDHHISVMVPIDSATEASGCLWFAPGHGEGQLPTDDRGRVHDDVAPTLDWQPLPVEPGDVVFFDSYAPHKSDTNATNHPRRALYLTYNAESRGDLRAKYYEDKQAEFEREGGTFDDERVRISVSDDFLGKPVSPPG